MMHDEPRRSRAVVGLLVLASLSILTLDARNGSDSSPVGPLRTVTGAILGPVEDAAAAALSPVTDIPGYLSNLDDLRNRNGSLQAANDALREKLRLNAANLARDSELSGISQLADTSGFTVVAAQVVAVGPAQSFSRTVTIDAGTSQGVVPDLTVINADGLVGRVLSATATTATVLLVIDAESTVGGRLSDSMELGFLDGDGAVSSAGTLELSLADHLVTPRVGDTVLSWGSPDGTPYVAGVPIGTVAAVHSSPAELTQTAIVRPFADFSSLDVVAVVTTARPQGKVLAGGSTR